MGVCKDGGTDTDGILDSLTPSFLILTLSREITKFDLSSQSSQSAESPVVNMPRKIHVFQRAKIVLVNKDTVRDVPFSEADH